MVDWKLVLFQVVRDTIRRTLQRNNLQKTRLMFCEVTVVSTCLYGLESCVVGKRDLSKIHACQMTFLGTLKVAIETIGLEMRS